MSLQDIDPQFLCETERYRQLARLESYYDGSQYDRNPSLKPWTDDSVPMRERRPDIVYPLPKAAVNQATRFALGEGKFPRLKVESSEAEDEFSAELAVDGDSAKALSRSLDDLAAKSCLASAVRTAMRRGLSARTACVALSLKDGKFCFEHPSPKDCIPYFVDGDPLGRTSGLTWSYQYNEEAADKLGRPVTVRKAFRRDYTDDEIVEYEPADVVVGKRIEWVERERIQHGLGECPIVWIPNMAHAGCEGVDGASMFDGLLDEFDALNRTLSQRHHALEIIGVPQPFESGVAKGDGPGAAGRTAMPAPTEARAPGGPGAAVSVRTDKVIDGKPVHMTFAPPGDVEGARKSGARHVWTYRGEHVTVGMVETTGKAFEIVSKHVNDIRSRLLEAMDVILLDPTSVAGKGDMSAKALALMYAPMLALVDELREWWWEHGIRKILDMMLRILERRGASDIYVKGAKKLEQTLKRRRIAIAGGESVFVPPAICPLWGAYFAQSAEEAKLEVETAAKAKAAKLISPSTATTYVASSFGVQDVDQEIDRIEDEPVAEQQDEEPPKPGGEEPQDDQPESEEPDEEVEAEDET